MIQVASDQPTFLPWIGFWHKLLSVDLMIWSIAVPPSYGKHDHYHNRVKVDDAWLTLPVTKDTRNEVYEAVQFDPAYQAKAARTLRNAFGKKYPYQNRVLEVADVLENYDGPPLLEALNRRLISVMAQTMDATMPMIREDRIRPDQNMTKTERLIARIRRQVDGPIQYHLGRGALSYIDKDQMEAAGIQLYVQNLAVPGGGTALHTIARDQFPVHTIKCSGMWTRVQ